MIKSYVPKINIFLITIKFSLHCFLNIILVLADCSDYINATTKHLFLKKNVWYNLYLILILNLYSVQVKKRNRQMTCTKRRGQTTRQV